MKDLEEYLIVSALILAWGCDISFLSRNSVRNFLSGNSQLLFFKRVDNSIFSIMMGFPHAFPFRYILKPFIFFTNNLTKAFLSPFRGFFSELFGDLYPSFLGQMGAFQLSNHLIFKEGYEDWIFLFLLGLPRDFKFHPILSWLVVCWEWSVDWATPDGPDFIQFSARCQCAENWIFNFALQLFLLSWIISQLGRTVSALRIEYLTFHF